MRFLRHFSSPVAQPTHRARLRDLHSFGLVSVFRSHSLLRLWGPLRGDPASDYDFEG